MNLTNDGWLDFIRRETASLGFAADRQPLPENLRPQWSKVKQQKRRRRGRKSNTPEYHRAYRERVRAHWRALGIIK